MAEGPREMLIFDRCLKLSKKHDLPVAQVRSRLAEFNAVDHDGDGTLSGSEFEQVIRNCCGLPSGEPIPHHLMPDNFSQADTEGNGSIDFEEFLLWYLNHAFAEEVMVPEPQEREIRRIARENDLPLPDVEEVKNIFDRFDMNKSGGISEEEFRKVVVSLLGAQSRTDVPHSVLARYWAEANADGSGELKFAEFLLWYFTIMDGR